MGSSSYSGKGSQSNKRTNYNDKKMTTMQEMLNLLGEVEKCRDDVENKKGALEKAEGKLRNAENKVKNKMQQLDPETRKRLQGYAKMLGDEGQVNDLPEKDDDQR